MKYTFIFLTIFLFNTISTSAQTHLPESFYGEWIMEKVELYDEPLNQPEKGVLKTFTTIPETEQFFLLNNCITKLEISIYAETGEEFNYVKTHFMEYKNLDIELDHHLILFKDRESGNVYYRYEYDFHSEDILILKTSDVYYNDSSNKPFKTYITLYFNRTNPLD